MTPGSLQILSTASAGICFVGYGKTSTSGFFGMSPESCTIISSLIFSSGSRNASDETLLMAVSVTAMKTISETMTKVNVVLPKRY